MRGGRAKKSRRRTARVSSRSGGERSARQRQRHAEKQPTSGEGRAAGWFLSKRPVLRFVLVFGVLVLAINVLLLARVKESPVIMRFLAWNADAAGVVLRVLGEETVVNDRSVTGRRYSLEVAHGCDAVQPTALFLSAVLATPVVVRRKLIGVAAGIAILLTINLVRIVSLYYVGVFIPRFFHVVHVEIWGAVFIFLSIALWLVWALWATDQRAPRAEHGVAEEQTAP